MLAVWKHVIYLKCKEQNVFNASMKGFVFLKIFVCSTFEVFKGGWLVSEKNVKMTFCVVIEYGCPLKNSPKKAL